MSAEGRKLLAAGKALGLVEVVHVGDKPKERPPLGHGRLDHLHRQETRVPDQVLIHGTSAERVERARGPLKGLVSCDGEHHCCAHGEGPVFMCCRCGSKFKRAL